MSEFLKDMAALSSAEDFFKTLDVPYDEHVVRVNRLHILKRLHDYLGREDLSGKDDAALKEIYRAKLVQAHQDFEKSDAVTERVFKVFQQVKGQAFLGLDAIEPLPKG